MLRRTLIFLSESGAAKAVVTKTPLRRMSRRFVPEETVDDFLRADDEVDVVLEVGVLPPVDDDLRFAAAHEDGHHDHAQNDIVMRRSTDNGKSWGEIQLIDDDGKNSLNDPCAVVLVSGRILLMYQMFPYGVHARNDGWIQIDVARRANSAIAAEKRYAGCKDD